MKTSPTCAGQAVASPRISDSEQIVEMDRARRMRRQRTGEIGSVPLVEVADPHAEVEDPLVTHQFRRRRIDEHPGERLAHHRPPRRRVRMLEKIAADEVVFVAETTGDLTVGIEKRPRVLDAAEAEREKARFHGEWIGSQVGAEDRRDDRAAITVEAEIDEVALRCARIFIEDLSLSRYFSPKRVTGRLKRNSRGTRSAAASGMMSGGVRSGVRSRISAASAA